MSEIKVPEGMLKAATTHVSGSFAEMAVEVGVEKALKWLSENPIVPTDEQMAELRKNSYPMVFLKEQEANRKLAQQEKEMCVEWQRRMFLADPETDDNLICEVGAMFRDRGIKVSNAQVAEMVNRLGNLPKCNHINAEPEEIKDLLAFQFRDQEKAEALIIEAYRRGRQSKP